MTVTAPGPTTATYSLAVGDCTNPVAPRHVTLVGSGDGRTILNTSVNLLNSIDYFCDAEVDIVGYRAIQKRVTCLS